MNKLFVSVIILFYCFFPSFARADEKIDDFSVVVKINQDASLDITETITYNFGEAIKHGIFRDIPYKYKARGGNFTLRLTDINVFDESDKAYKYEVSDKGNYKNIKIGDANEYVTGVKSYIIKYNVSRAINYFTDHDELYWNITGNEWPVTIDAAKANIILPISINEKNIDTKCFVGLAGSQDECVSYRYNYNGQEVNNIVFTNDRLKTGEGMTVVVGWPKGAVHEPTIIETILAIIKDNGIVFLPVIVLIVMIYLFITKGKDPAGRGTIIAQFGPPEDMTPAEVGTLIDESAENHEISAEIIDLAVRGYLKIKKIEGKGILKSTDYELIKLKDGVDLTSDFDRQIFVALFGTDKLKVKLSDLKNKFYTDLNKIKQSLYRSSVEKNFFPRSPRTVRGVYIGIGIAFFIGGWFMGPIFGWLGVVSTWISGVIIVIFSFFMPARTKEGVLVREHILGLKEYLRVAERDRIKFHNAPEKNPKHFEKLLPYAMVLKVEKEWAKQFSDLYDKQPNWYEDAGQGHFNALALTNSLSSFENKANSTISSRPSSASSGGSGFSGGSSGGGFGGGGGGSW